MKTLFSLLLLVFASPSAQAGSGAPVNYSALGFVRAAAITPPVNIGRPHVNAETALKEIHAAVAKQASIIAFPELNISSYTAEDLFSQEGFLAECTEAVAWLAQQTKDVDALIIVGAPYRAFDGRLYNVAFVMHRGKILGAVPKSHLPNYAEFYERRWFIPGGDVEMEVDDELLGKFHLGTRQLFKFGEVVLGVEICEDLFAVIPPSSHASLAGANFIVNLSASDELIGKAAFRRALVTQQAARLIAAYLYVSAGPTESSKDLVFGGHMMISENGSMLAEGKRYQRQGETIFADVDIQKIMHERSRNTTLGNQRLAGPAYRVNRVAMKPELRSLDRKFSPSPFVPSRESRDEVFGDIVEIQSEGIIQRFMSSKAETAIIGISGGKDSTVALKATMRAFDKLGWSRKRIITPTMPGPGTSRETLEMSYALMEAAGTTILTMPITDIVNQHFKDIGHDPAIKNNVYENAQARPRTWNLFSLANKYNGIVIGTGDLSELCLGWCTFNGDHMSNYGVNASIPKTLMMHLISWFAENESDPKMRRVLEAILKADISPELLPPTEDGKIAQLTEDKIGPYELHDYFIYHTLRNGFSPEKIYRLAELTSFEKDYSKDEIKKWLKTFLFRLPTNQWKRSVAPAGAKVGSVSVSPRGDLRLPDEIDCSHVFDKVENL